MLESVNYPSASEIHPDPNALNFIIPSTNSPEKFTLKDELEMYKIRTRQLIDAEDQGLNHETLIYLDSPSRRTKCFAQSHNIKHKFLSIRKFSTSKKLFNNINTTQPFNPNFNSKIDKNTTRFYDKDINQIIKGYDSKSITLDLKNIFLSFIDLF
jgi:hypothetical protein